MKHVKLFCFLNLMLFVLLNYGIAQDRNQLKSYNKLRTSKGVVEPKFNWNTKKSSIKQFRGKIQLDKDKKHKKTRSLLDDFFLENENTFGITKKKNTLSFHSKKKNRDTKHFIYQQKYKGIPVFRHEYRIRVNKENELVSLKGTFNPKISLASIQPLLSKNNAKETAFSSVNSSLSLVTNLQSKLVVFDLNDKYFLAWKVSFDVVDKPEAWLILVDAKNSSILHKESLVTDITGSGNAYNSHPGNGSPVTKSLSFLGTSHYLDGTYVKTHNSDASNAYSSNYQFSYSPSHTSFDEVNVYYHITRMQNNFFKALDPSYTPIKRNAYVHYGINWDNANASFSGILRFGDGDWVFNDLAKDESVIYHENAHVFIFEASGLGGGNSQQGAMHEGWADYFAATFAPDAIDHEIGEWATKASGPLRDLENNATFNGSFSQDWTGNGSINQYDYALVWAGALWDCRQSPYNVPASAIDWVSYDALHSLVYADKFSDALTEILISDNETYYPSNHVSAIRSAFNNRGIYENVSSWTSGPEMLEFKEFGTWVAHPSGGNNSFTYKWEYKASGSSSWTTVGTAQSYSRMMWLDGFELRTTVTSVYGLSTVDISEVLYSDGIPIPKISDESNKSTTITNFNLKQNYPNPFNPTTRIEYSIDSDQFVTLNVYNVLGKKVESFVNKYQSSGTHSIYLNASHLASGVYYFELRAGSKVSRKKGILLR